MHTQRSSTLRHILAFGICLIFLGSCSGRQSSLSASLDQLMADHKALEALEKSVFDRLVFTASSKRLSRSQNFKVILKDQLGRNWLFKAGYFASAHGAPAVYRFFTLFGLDTPELHNKTFTLNGQEIKGTIQRFMTPIGTMGELGPNNFTFFPTSAIEYFARNHLMSWLIVNHHVWPGQFLVMENENGVRSALHVDNTIEWFLIGNDRLSIDYASPMLTDTTFVGYQRFWRSFLNAHLVKKGVLNQGALRSENEYGSLIANFLEFDLSRQLAWARLITEFPEGYYQSFFEAGLRNKCRGLPNAHERTIWNQAPEAIGNMTCDKFLPRAMARKKNLLQDAAAFYKTLEFATGKPVNGKPSNEESQAVLREISAFHSEKRKSLERDAGALDALGTALTQPPLELETSFKGHQAILLVAKVKVMSKPRQKALLEAAAKDLNNLLPDSANPYERKAVLAAIGNVESLLSCLDSKTFPGNSLIHLNKFFVQGWIKASGGNCIEAKIE